EVNDLAMNSLFNELAYQHFKVKNWEGMLRNKYRLKFQPYELKEEIKHILNNQPIVAKQLLKADRIDIVNKLSKLEMTLPINFNNIVFLINHIELKNDDITNLTPEFIKVNV